MGETPAEVLGGCWVQGGDVGPGPGMAGDAGGDGVLRGGRARVSATRAQGHSHSTFFSSIAK